MTMGDRVAVLKDGILQQVDTPLNLYDKPSNLFVAGFIGSPAMNLLRAHNVDGHAKLGDIEVPIDRDAAGQAHGDITIGVRPESWRIVGEGEGIPVKVTVVEELGADGFVYGTSGAEGTPDQVIVRIDARRSHHKGDTIYVTTDPSTVHVFDTESGIRLSK
jgi:multiple sugar transport system ATP-binding protein